jgi:hypothetical protein
MGILEREVRPINPRYFWLEPSSGGDADMIAKRYPGVRLLYDEALLPINKLAAVWIETVDIVGMFARLYLFWRVQESNVWIRGNCFGPSDERLTSQFAAYPEFGQRFTEGEDSANFKREEIKSYKVGEQISESELPEFIKPYIFRVKTWKKVIGELWSNFIYGYDSNITPEGYYVAIIKPSSLLLSRTEEQYEEQEGINRYIKLFNFNAQTEPPEVGEEGVHWVLEEQKVILALPHTAASLRVVDYYGYREEWLKGLARQRPERLKSWQAELISKSL